MPITTVERRNDVLDQSIRGYRSRGRVACHPEDSIETPIAGYANSASRLETTCTIAMLFYTTGAVVPLVTGGADKLTPSSGLPPPPLALAIKLCIYAVALLLVARRWRMVVQGARRIQWILLPVLIAAVSILWSQAIPVTLRSVPVLLGTTVFGVYFGIRYTVPQQLRLLAGMFSAVIVLSVIFAILLPAYGIDIGATTGDWRGIFLQKNGLGEMMVLAFFVFLFLQTDHRRQFRWVGMAAALALLFLSKSATSIVVCAALLAAMPLYRLPKARFTLVIPICIVGTIGLTILALFVDGHTAGVLGLVGRQPDLTGRTELWKGVVAAIANRPWLGYGFSAFWTGMKGPSGLILESIGWTAGYAHNGFLDLMLQLGIVGLLTYVAGYLLLWRRAISLLRRQAGPVLRWLCTFLLFMLLYNLTEGSILGQDTIGWLLYISVAVAILTPYPDGVRAENLNGRQL